MWDLPPKTCTLDVKRQHLPSQIITNASTHTQILIGTHWNIGPFFLKIRQRFTTWNPLNNNLHHNSTVLLLVVMATPPSIGRTAVVRW